MEKNSAETYTIDTGQRRSVGNAPSKVCRLDRYGGAFLHGSLHTVHYYFGPNGFLCVFDFESEQIGSFHYLYNVPVTEFTG